jgi:hypothetical protein
MQSKQVSASASSSIINYRLSCGFSASVFAQVVPKKDKKAPCKGFPAVAPAGMAGKGAAGRDVFTKKMHRI